MKTIILAGGFVSRLDNLTKVIPKPLVKVHKYPILIYIMQIYISFGFTEFIIALGYKGEKIVEYFTKKRMTSSLKKKMRKGIKIKKKIKGKSCDITLVDTGKKSLTGGRLKRASKFVNEKTFFMTYGDGLADINLKNLLKLHMQKKPLATVTAVNPPARFGELKIKKNIVSSFSEKKPIKQSWINGGFFCLDKKFINFIRDDLTILERAPLETVSKKGKLYAYKHIGFWQCMDTKRDKDNIDRTLKKKNFFFK